MIPKLDNAPKLSKLYSDFLDKLARSGFKGDIRRDYAERITQSTDNSVYQLTPEAVLYPAGIEDIVILTRLASDPQYRRIQLSPRGGGTGTNGQSLTQGLMVDVSKYMNKVLEINTAERWARVQAGVVKDQLNAELKPHGLFFAPDLSTSNRATIGGMVNTDASGQGSCLYGKTRDHVLELKTILMDGSVLDSFPLDDGAFRTESGRQDRIGAVHRLVDAIDKEHAESIRKIFPPLNRCLTGYDLAHIRNAQGRFDLNAILCGSEGTLGFVAEAKLNLLTIPPHATLVVVKYADFDAALRDADELMQAEPTSIETVDSKVLNLAMQDFVWHQVETFFSDPTPVPVRGINLVEFTGYDKNELKQKVDAFVERITASIAQGGERRIGLAVAEGKDAVNSLWSMRKRAVGLLGNAEGEARPVPFVEDTAVPPDKLADYIAEFRRLLNAYGLDYGMFGHVDAGVLHVRPALDMKDPVQERLAWDISDKVVALTQKYGGLLWGEHGKGIRSHYAPA
ncbi:MAG: FAD-binding oxidoreductase, partial [Gammaproteobacteria bacterium]